MEPNQTSRTIGTAELEDFASRLRTWRQTRKAGQRIPEELWREAVNLTRIHGVSPVATALKLNYRALQRRSKPGEACPQAGTVSPTFVQLPTSAWTGGSSEPSTVEVQRACGTRLTIRLPQVATKDLLTLVESLLGRGI